MLTAENTVTIDRPIADVFAFVADGETAPRWRPAVVSIKLKSGSKGAAGAVYAQQVKGGPMGNVPADYEITKSEPNRRLEFRAVAGPVRPQGYYQFDDKGGATQITFGLSCEPSGMMKMMSGMIQKSMQSEVACLANLKAVLET
jgi:uncharacterized membrane protein